MSPNLSVVAANATVEAASRNEPLSEKIRRLQNEARTLARDHITALEQALETVERMSAEIADGGEAYPAGVREIARRLVDECEVRVQALEAIVARS